MPGQFTALSVAFFCKKGRNSTLEHVQKLREGTLLYCHLFQSLLPDSVRRFSLFALVVLTAATIAFIKHWKLQAHFKSRWGAQVVSAGTQAE